MSFPDQPIPDISEAIHRKLDQLGVQDNAEALERLFDPLDAKLEQDINALFAHGVPDPKAVETFRVHWLGRSQGIVSAISEHWFDPRWPHLKRVVGKRMNALRDAAQEAIERAKREYDSAMLAAARGATAGQPLELKVAGNLNHWQDSIAVELGIDVTLPGHVRPIGVRHPIQTAIHEISEIFRAVGFSVEEGPEIESVYYNFEALNIPEDHPSRDDQDTFYIDANTVLRTHTSPVQIRTMERQKPPLRIIVPGKVYRNETPDASHACMFHQVEGLAVDTNITFADLKGTLDYFMKAYYGAEVRTRFRPSFFPFTEPSAEMDVSCIFCGGKGCRICKGSGWLEMGGCGMVDPAVFSYVRYDPAQYSGFAFGFGIERLAMLKYGVNDIQQFVQGDVRFLHQFR